MSIRRPTALATVPTSKPAAMPRWPAVDRRTGQDRRERDLPPPGRERRRGVEPRRPEVTELDLTPSQWGALKDER